MSAFAYVALGAPTEIVRGQVDPKLETPANTSAPLLQDDPWRQISRVRSRFYYPVDHHALKRARTREEHAYYEGAHHSHLVWLDDRVQTQRDSLRSNIDPELGLVLTYGSARDDAYHALLRAADYASQKHTEGLAQARHKIVGISSNSKVTQKSVLRKLLVYRGYEQTYMPRVASEARRDCGLTKEHALRTKVTSMDREVATEPAYALPPVDADLLHEAAKDASEPVPNVGNCLLLTLCPCRYCAKQEQKQVLTLYPTGPLLDHVRVSALQFPNQSPFLPCNLAVFKANSNKQTTVHFGIAFEIDLGDSCRDLIACGEQLFCARTDTTLVFFFVVPAYKAAEQKADKCLGAWMELKTHRVIDQRSMTIDQPSYYPVDVTSHPKYHGTAVGSRLAILYRKNQESCNTVGHYSTNQSRFTAHNITNLRDVSRIAFAQHNPMVLWSAACSYVRPVPAHRVNTRTSLVGHGHSLYTIDLRSNTAFFQWSPSAETGVTEGVHSVAGIHVDWNDSNRLYVTSTTAGKTWELDCRIPCRAVTSWVLPHVAESGGMAMHSSETDSGSILFMPQFTSEATRVSGPLLSASRNPGTSDLYLFQRPANGPAFQTDPIECSDALPILNSAGLSLSQSQVFPLPNRLGPSRTIGAAAVRISPCHTKEPLDTLKDDNCLIMCTMSSNGDVYSHCILESQGNLRGKLHHDFPVGGSAVCDPWDYPSDEPSTNILKVRLDNTFRWGRDDEIIDKGDARKTASDALDGSIRGLSLASDRVDHEDKRPQNEKPSHDEVSEYFVLPEEAEHADKHLQRSDLSQDVLARVRQAWDKDSDDEYAAGL